MSLAFGDMGNLHTLPTSSTASYTASTNQVSATSLNSGRVAPVSVRFPSHNEGAPGPSPLGTGEVRSTASHTAASNQVSATSLNSGLGLTYDATVNGIKSTVSFNSTSTPQSIASALATAIQGASGSDVTAKSDGDINVLVSSSTGTSDDYAITTAVTYDSTDFFAPSFAAAAYTMQDGVAADSSDGLVYYYYVPNGGYAPNGRGPREQVFVRGVETATSWRTRTW